MTGTGLGALCTYLVVGFGPLSWPSCVARCRKVRIPGRDCVREVRVQLELHRLADSPVQPVKVGDPVELPTDIGEAGVQRFQIRVVLETALHEAVVLSACLHYRCDAVDITAVVDSDDFPALLRSHGHEERVPGGL